jgi:hypothetical protein
MPAETPEAPIQARVGDWSAVLGPMHIVNALAATIRYRLEPEEHLKHVPIVLGQLFRGALAPGQAAAALAELDMIQQAFEKLPRERAIWSLADLRRLDDSTLPVHHQARHLAEYFIAPDGTPLLAVLREAVLQCQRQNRVLTVDTWFRRSGFVKAAFFLITGLAAALALWWWNPNACAAPNPQGLLQDAPHGIPLWALGLAWAGIGGWDLLSTLWPAAAELRIRYPFLASLLMLAAYTALVVLTRR